MVSHFEKNTLPFWQKMAVCHFNREGQKKFLSFFRKNKLPYLVQIFCGNACRRHAGWKEIHL
jgi:hypothetical protein